ncbi:phage terminase small subunit [Yersinia similis]|nr:phage terminase small subunit [Yersinia similis]CNC67141.1 phage terminase small subunit [Yersinia similis]CNE88747.1 phage terminase small subunit [Yersinia similis]
MTLTEEQKALFDALTQLQRRFVTALLSPRQLMPQFLLL